ncbi:MAG: hypothetical protein JJU41_11245 [Bacteroidetes bacterium]|nr:hypothetical protein [Bacteroidota bacterium]
MKYTNPGSGANVFEGAASFVKTYASEAQHQRCLHATRALKAFDNDEVRTLQPLQVIDSLTATFPRLDAPNLQEIHDVELLNRLIHRIQHWYAVVLGGGAPKETDMHPHSPKQTEGVEISKRDNFQAHQDGADVDNLTAYQGDENIKAVSVDVAEPVLHGDLHLGNILWSAADERLWIIDVTPHRTRFERGVFQDVLLFTISVGEHPSLSPKSMEETAWKWLQLLQSVNVYIPRIIKIYVVFRVIVFMGLRSGRPLKWTGSVLRALRALW